MQITHFFVLSDKLDGFCFLWCSFSVCVFCIESRTGGKPKVGINGVFSYEYSCALFCLFLEILLLYMLLCYFFRKWTFCFGIDYSCA
jgi:hypothetical protein